MVENLQFREEKLITDERPLKTLDLEQNGKQ